MCERILDAGCHFLLTCKPDSHPTLYEWLEELEGCGAIGVVRVQRWTGKERLTDTYRYAEQVPLRDGADGLLVNWCELTTTYPAGQVRYHNAFATDHPISEANVVECVAAGRGSVEGGKREQQHLEDQEVSSGTQLRTCPESASGPISYLQHPGLSDPHRIGVDGRAVPVNPEQVAQPADLL